MDRPFLRQKEIIHKDRRSPQIAINSKKSAVRQTAHLPFRVFIPIHREETCAALIAGGILLFPGVILCNMEPNRTPLVS